MFPLKPAVALGLALLAPCLPAQHAAKKTAAASSTAPAAMTNDDVIALAGAGMSDQIVIAKIKAAPSTSFDTSVAGLKSLKAANVSGNVIAVMIDPTAPVAAPAPATAVAAASSPTDPDDPASVHPAGIYLYSKGQDGIMHLTVLQSERSKQYKGNGAILSGLTYGIAKNKSKAVFDGAAAPVATSDNQPVFYAYIPESQNNSFGSNGFSVKDLVLLKFEVKGDTRMITTASANIFGSSAGTDEKARQGFTSDLVKPGIYKLTPAAALPQGQYAFSLLNASYYDFGIQPST